MALRLEKAGWSNAEFWLRRQTTYDLVCRHARTRTGSMFSDTGRSPRCEASGNHIRGVPLATVHPRKNSFVAVHLPRRVGSTLTS